MTSTYYTNRDDAPRVPPITRRRPTLACLRCRTRRVKCDRAFPACGNCSKSGHECIQAMNSTTTKSHSCRSASFNQESVDNHSRISKLEEEVERLTREVNSHSPRGSSPNCSPVVSAAPSEKELQGMVVSMPQSRYFSPYSWAAVSEELADINNMMGHTIGGVGEFSPTSPNAEAHMAFSGQPERVLPLPNHELSTTLIQLFAQRVDPMIRLLHLPSFLNRLHTYQSQSMQPSQQMQYQNSFKDSSFHSPHAGAYQTHSPHLPVQRAPRPVNREFETLLFAVYYAAITSIIADPNGPYLGKDVDVHALAAAFKREVSLRLALLDDVELIRNGTLEILQASVLMLSVDPRSAIPRSQWIRLGCATRMAQGMGLHRDPAQYGLKPIEIEIRRRVWAQICLLDMRFAEELGCEPTILIGSYDTCLPLSISDDELTALEMKGESLAHGPSFSNRPGSISSLGLSHQVLTESQQHHSPFSPMTLSLIRYEAARVSGKLFLSTYLPKDSIFHKAAPPSKSNSKKSERGGMICSLAEKSYWVDLLEEKFQQVYKVDSLDPTDQLQYFVTTLAHIHIMKARFVIKLQRWKDAVGTMDVIEREKETNKLFREAIDLTRSILTMIYDRRASEWYWYTKRLKEVYTSSFVLFNLACGRNLESADVQAAWQAMDQLFFDPSDSSHRSPLGRLLALARARREQQQRESDADNPVSSTVTSASHIPQYHVVPPPMLPVSGEGLYQHAYAPLSGTMFENLGFMMQDPLWVEMAQDVFSNNSPPSWGANVNQAFSSC
ncbi:hypothetical protein GQ43DRAFT_436806 [Delitschia confertaspora ATCC 74209]|uniref:Zn(2)-C6 fungal-type domain-containing protein n=1 Tax=Delitschia confertaspora ATCC 74209 TaxID=1513339 RepID=A0A9P4MX15_9PLEO|nr:hypothetical protein GQ43DRAFT_436806 [Delitschia confertaspora ATCC 74209]